MKIHRKYNRHSTQFLFTLLLFFLLTLCAFLTITFGAKVYQNIEADMGRNFKDTTIFSYISNKIKQSDSTEAVAVLEYDGIKVLRIREYFEGKGYATYIYYHNGEVKEVFLSEEQPFDLLAGNLIMESNEITFEMQGENLLKIYEPKDKERFFFIYLRSGGTN